ncbi:MAG: GGDEF and EAL domain-containing protein [Tepidanaerobacteraceae bacterium]|nr:GGDEF and EAL domain-containing protein [Tepidanaerobacteraceae bacterium]
MIPENPTADSNIEEKCLKFFESSGCIFWDWDSKHDMAYFMTDSGTAESAESSKISCRNGLWWGLMHPADKERVKKALDFCLANKVPFFQASYRIKTGNGGYTRIMTKGVPAYDSDGCMERMTGFHVDVTIQKKYEDKLKRLINYDFLTNLPNRFIFMENMNKVLSDASKNGKRPAVFLLDIDNLESINSDYGYAVGDCVLKLAAKTLKKGIGEKGMISRIAGDEFVILQPDLGGINEAAKFARSLLQLFENPLRVHELKLCVTVCIGIAIYPENGNESETLLKNAGFAMRKAKSYGRHGFHFFERYNEMAQANRIQRDMKKALNREEFFLCYQPIVNAKTGRIVAMEALARWAHPERGIVCPGDFINVAEETNLIVPIGEYILRNACRQMKMWIDRGLDFCISVNVSPKQLQTPDFVGMVKNVLNECGLSPNCLYMEITENAIIRHFSETVKNLILLSKAGIKLALDDFGIGYSSLKYLKELPISMLKIDSAFVRSIDEEIDRAIIDLILALGKKMRYEVVAEGVELREQADFLKTMGCDLMQGFLFSEPLPADDIEKILRKDYIDITLLLNT